MRYLPTSKLTPGMALGQDIYDGAGRLLLAKHLLLSEEYISNLEFLGFPGIYIDDEFTQGIEIQQVLNPQVRSQALKVVHDMFAFDAASDAEEDMPVSEIKIQKTIERIVENILSNGDIMCNVLDIKNYDDYIYYHSINVAMMSVLLGANYGMNEESLYQLTTAAILHDIGKRFLDIGIINADHALTEEETQLLRKHPELGADYLKGNYHFLHSYMRVSCSIMKITMEPATQWERVGSIFRCMQGSSGLWNNMTIWYHFIAEGKICHLQMQWNT